jgi:hypothetical protein
MVHLPCAQASADRMPLPGDTVLFYETKTPGPTTAPGEDKIVLVATVSGLIDSAGPKAEGRSWQIPWRSDRSGNAINAEGVRKHTRHRVLIARAGWSLVRCCSSRHWEQGEI